MKGVNHVFVSLLLSQLSHENFCGSFVPENLTDILQIKKCKSTSVKNSIPNMLKRIIAKLWIRQLKKF